MPEAQFGLTRRYSGGAALRPRDPVVYRIGGSPVFARPQRTPSYRHHKPSGQAVVTIGRRDIYLGKFDTPESRTEYDRVIAEWLGNGRNSAPRAT